MDIPLIRKFECGYVGGAKSAGATEVIQNMTGDTPAAWNDPATVGVLVIDYEVWNLIWPSLTNMAAKDFSPEPSMAESWTSSDDGLTWTYKMRRGHEVERRRADDRRRREVHDRSGQRGGSGTATSASRPTSRRRSSTPTRW